VTVDGEGKVFLNNTEVSRATSAAAARPQEREPRSVAAPARRAPSHRREVQRQIGVRVL